MRDAPAPAPIVPDPLGHPNPKVAAYIRADWELCRAEKEYGPDSPEREAAHRALIAAFDRLTRGELRQAFDAVGPRHRRAANAREMPKVRALMAAGWSIDFDDMQGDLEPWQWSWRRPSRRPGKPGRRFASTGQAFNRLMRERGGP